MVEAEFGRLFISMMQRKRHLRRSSATYRASTTSPMTSRRAYPNGCRILPKRSPPHHHGTFHDFSRGLL